MGLFRYKRDLLIHLVQRDFVLRYKRSALGILWSLLVPLAQFLVLSFVFGKIVALNIPDYPAFLFAGLLPWTWFSSCIGLSGGIFLNNRDLMFQPNFNPVYLVVVNTLSNLIIYLISIPILFALLVFYNRPLTTFLVFWPVLVLIEGLFITGVSLIIATMNVYYRDVEHCVGIAILLLFYITPVFYAPNAIPEPFSIFYTLNPLAVLIMHYRSVFLFGSQPGIVSLLILGLFSLFVTIIGYLLYRNQLPRIMDEI